MFRLDQSEAPEFLLQVLFNFILYQENLCKDVYWNIKCFTSETLGFVENTTKEDEENAIKNNWEISEPGRSIKAKVSRTKALLLHKKKNGDKLNYEDEIILSEPREIRLSNVSSESKIATLSNKLNLPKTPARKVLEKKAINEAIKKEKKPIKESKEAKKREEEVLKELQKQQEESNKFTTIFGYNYQVPKKTLFSIYNSSHPSKKINSFIKYCSQDRIFQKDSSLTDKDFVSKLSILML